VKDPEAVDLSLVKIDDLLDELKSRVRRKS
jgi:hypothetical protein